MKKQSQDRHRGRSIGHRRGRTAPAGYAWYAVQPARYYEYWHVPDRQPVPPRCSMSRSSSTEVNRAPRRDVERRDAGNWQSLIEQQQPHEFDLSREISTTDARPRHVEKLLGCLGKRPCRASCGRNATAWKAERGPQASPSQIRRDGGARPPLRGPRPRWADMKEEDYAIVLADIWRAKRVPPRNISTTSSSTSTAISCVSAGAEPPIGANADHAQSRPGPDDLPVRPSSRRASRKLIRGHESAAAPA